MRRLLVTAAVLVALLVGADRVAAAVAERVIAQQLQASGGLRDRPAVSVRGIPFLTQALSGRYGRIDLSAQQVSRRALSFTSLDVAVSGARVPLGDALGGQITAVPVEGLRATVLVDYGELARRSGVNGLRLTPVDGAVEVTGTVVVLGQRVRGRTRSEVRLAGGDLVVTARSLAVEGATRSARVERALKDRLDFRVDLAVLPYGLQTTGVRVAPEGLTISAATGPTVLQQP